MEVGAANMERGKETESGYCHPYHQLFLLQIKLKWKHKSQGGLADSWPIHKVTGMLAGSSPALECNSGILLRAPRSAPMGADGGVALRARLDAGGGVLRRVAREDGHGEPREPGPATQMH